VYHRSVPLIGGVAALAGKRVAIFGAGMEGQCFARRFGESFAELALLDDVADDSSESGQARREALASNTGFEVQSPLLLEDRPFDFVVHSPGVSRFDERLGNAVSLGAIVTTPTALFMEDFSGRRTVAVTGSKGKTTTAMLAAAALGSYGLDVALGGNIGRPVSDWYDDAAHDVFVLELSSYQTAELTSAPSVGVLTLLAPDHLEWHRGLETYYEDKLRLFSLRPGQAVAVNGCCEEAVTRTRVLSGRVLYGCGGPVRLEGNSLVASELGQLDLGGFQLLGEHNLLNACGAVTAGLLLMGELPDKRRLEAELSMVTAPRSRLEPVGVLDDVSYIDDALASNPEGTLVALKVFAGRQVALICGGHDRGVDFTPLAQAIEASSPKPFVLLIGDAGDALGAALAHIDAGVPRQRVASLEAAVALAASLPGVSVVLFSPAAPTPSEEGNYLDRGRRFREAAGLAQPGEACHGAPSRQASQRPVPG
jgi:UDP-N-acetylmuramoylalanine--D-glutamate ligase